MGVTCASRGTWLYGVEDQAEIVDRLDQDGATAALGYCMVLIVKSYHMPEESVGLKEVAPLTISLLVVALESILGMHLACMRTVVTTPLATLPVRTVMGG